MKKIFFILTLMVSSLTIAQTESPNNGFLPSRVSTATHNAFVNPAKGIVDLQYYYKCS